MCQFRTYKKSSEELYATFNTSGLNLLSNEKYQLVINNKVYDKTIQIIEGVDGKLNVEVYRDMQLYRPNQTAFIDIFIQNFGDSDKKCPIYFISKNSNGAQNSSIEIKSINEELYEDLPYGYLIGFNRNSLGCIIPPRSSTSLRIKIRPNDHNFASTASLDIIAYKDEFFRKYIQEKVSKYKVLTNYQDDIWNFLCKKLIEKVDLQSDMILYETVNQLSINNINVYRLDFLILYHIDRLDGAHVINEPVFANDFTIIENELNYVRIYSSRYSIRQTKKSAHGYGWCDNMNVKLTKIKELDAFILFIHGNEHTIQMKKRENIYFSSLFEIEYDESLVQSIISDKKAGMIYTYDMKTNSLLRFQTKSGQLVYLTYEGGGLIKEILTTDSTIHFTYTSTNLISSITKTLLDGSNELIMYKYEDRNVLISVVSSVNNYKYDYDDNDNLIKAYTNGILRLEYGYNEDSLLESIREYDISEKLIIDNSLLYSDNGVTTILDNINNQSIDYLFDLDGDVASITENNSRVFKYSYDKQSESSLTTLNDVPIKVLTYDKKSNTISMFTGNENPIKFKLIVMNDTHEINEFEDRKGNKVTKTVTHNENVSTEDILYLCGLRKTKIYDQKQLSFPIDNGNKKVSITHDDLFRKISHSHATGKSNQECYYKYNKNNQLISASSKDNFDSVFLIYDMNKRITKQLYKINQTIEYIYNDINVDTIRSNDNYYVKYLYNDQNKLTGMRSSIDNDDLIIKINYLNNGYELINQKVSRLYTYIYDCNNKFLMKYTIRDLITNDNLITYEYEYDSVRKVKTLVHKTSNEG